MVVKMLEETLSSAVIARDHSRAERRCALFAALGDKTRLRLCPALVMTDRCPSQAQCGSKVTRQAITKHLRVMAEASLRSRRHGRESVCIGRAALEDARRTRPDFKQWMTLLQLRKFVED